KEVKRNLKNRPASLHRSRRLPPAPPGRAGGRRAGGRGVVGTATAAAVATCPPPPPHRRGGGTGGVGGSCRRAGRPHARLPECCCNVRLCRSGRASGRRAVARSWSAVLSHAVRGRPVLLVGPRVSDPGCLVLSRYGIVLIVAGTFALVAGLS